MADIIIRIQNVSGKPQRYVLIGECPSGTTTSTGLRCVFQIMRLLHNAESSFDLRTRYSAVCCRTQGLTEHGQVVVSGSIPVQLGSTTVDLVIHDGNAKLRQGTSGEVPKGAFNLRIGALNTGELKNPNSIAVGLGATETGAGSMSALGVFIPQSDTTYQLTPSNVAYLTVGDNFRQGLMVDAERLAGCIKIDFSNKDDFSFVHNDKGQLVLK